MSLIRWNPWREMEQFAREWRNLADQLAREGGSLADSQRVFTLPVDAYETDDNIVVSASVPGMKPEDIQISIEDNVLRIRGEHQEERKEEKANWVLRERVSGRFERALRLTVPVDVNKAEAVFENGVLTLTLPKAPEAKPFAIRVKKAGE